MKKSSERARTRRRSAKKVNARKSAAKKGRARGGRSAAAGSRGRSASAASRTYERPRAAGAKGGLKRVPKSRVGATVQDFVDFDNARLVTASSQDGVLFDVARIG